MGREQENHMALTGIYERWMYYILILFALGSNIAPVATITAIIAGCVLVIVHRVREGAWPDFDRSLMKWFGLYFFCMVFNFIRFNRNYEQR